jgi:hypothetical protein
LTTFGGLLHPATLTGTPSGAALLPAWESGLWTGNYIRNSILVVWGHRANVVVTDGVENAGFIPRVIGLNAE